MKILLHDYAGHEFPVQLAKQLKHRGHHCIHSYCSSNVTPHADFASAVQEGVELRPIDLGRRFEKHRVIRRAIDEVDYGIRSARQLNEQKPDQLIAAQLPVLSLLILQLAAARLGTPMILWLQDIQADIARTQSRGAGALLAALERRALRNASSIVTISDEMADAARAANPDADVMVVENWADTDKIKPGNKHNAWAIQQGLDHTFNFVYSGTLGIKHRPEALLELARSMRPHSDVRIVVVSQGAGTDQLTEMAETSGLPNLVLLPLQPAEVLPDVLASADVMVALLEADAASGCVPSKILAYLAAGRPTLGLFPSTNLASRIINERSGAGFAVETVEQLTSAASELRDAPDLLDSMGSNARSYAETFFDVSSITDRFEQLFKQERGKHHEYSQ